MGTNTHCLVRKILFLANGKINPLNTSKIPLKNKKKYEKSMKNNN